MPAGFVMFAPPAYVPRSMAFPTSPVSPDAVLLTTARVGTAFAGGRLGRMLVQGVARDLTKRGVKAIEAFGDAKFGEDASDEESGGCVAPADYFVSVGFKTVRPHPRYPRLRLELRTALSWKSDVEYALEKLLGSISPETVLRPGRPAGAPRPPAHPPRGRPPLPVERTRARSGDGCVRRCARPGPAGAAGRRSNRWARRPRPGS